MAKKTYKYTRVKIVEDLNKSGDSFNDSLEKLGELLGELAEAGDVTCIVDDLEDGVSRSKVCDQVDDQANRLYDLFDKIQNIIDDMSEYPRNLDEVVDYLLEEGTKKKSKKKASNQLQN